ncbi:minor capsid protein [Facklamia languida]
MNNDFQLNLLNFINGLGLPIEARLDYLTEHEDLVIYPLPGGKIIQLFMDGTKEMELVFEVTVKSKDQELANSIMWSINEALSQIDLSIPSKNGSYQFLSLETTKPFLLEKDDQGYFIYLLDLKAILELEEK